MEPMALGSPNNSPATGSNPYLPSFLTGEINSPSTPRTNTLSPTKRRTLSFATSPNIGISSPSDFNNSLSFGQKGTLFGQQQQQYGSQSGTTNPQNLNTSISTGPPKQGLFDSLREEMNQIQTPKKSILNQSQNLTTTPGTPIFNDSYLNQSNLNLSRITSPVTSYNLTSNLQGQQHSAGTTKDFDTSFTQSYSSLQQNHADFWVTVFGFPPNATSMILSHFSQYGCIVDKVLPIQNCNWIHIRYSSRLECDKALNYNEKVLHNNIMIGVTKCKDPNIIDKENLNDNNQCFKIRPLTQVAYKNKQCELSVVQCPPAPQRNSGIMNKAMDLLFGW